jgi:hypothetical protein
MTNTIVVFGGDSYGDGYSGDRRKRFRFADVGGVGARLQELLPLEPATKFEVEHTKEEESIEMDNSNLDRKVHATKKQPSRSTKKIGNYFVIIISTTSVTDLLPTQSKDDGDEACKMTASVSTAATNAITTRSMLKDPTEVFVAVVNKDDKKPPLSLEWTRIGKSPTDSFDVVEIEEVKWGMRICTCDCQEIADPTTSVLFHDEHGNNQAWLSEQFNTRTDYSIKLVPIRIPSNLKNVEMYREAAREMRSLPEYCNDYVFFEYLIHLMIQEVNCDNMLQSIVIQVTLCSTARLGASMSEYGWTNKGNSEKSP